MVVSMDINPKGVYCLSGQEIACSIKLHKQTSKPLDQLPDAKSFKT